MAAIEDPDATISDQLDRLARDAPGSTVPLGWILDQLHERATFGSVVRTDQGNYFISISAGRLMADGQKYFAISPQTPLAKEFLRKVAGERAQFNDRAIRILEVF
ncbi:MAG: hypothetical protein AAF146_24555 [Bacteroidota bacterium]